MTNSKFEYLNTKQIPNPKFKTPNGLHLGHWDIRNWDLFSTSNLDFRIWGLV